MTPCIVVDGSNLKTEAAGYSETCVTTYYTTQCRNPDYQYCKSHPRENFKSPVK